MARFVAMSTAGCFLASVVGIAMCKCGRTRRFIAVPFCLSALIFQHSPAGKKPEIPAGQTGHPSLNPSSKTLSKRPGNIHNTTLHLTEKWKLITACTMQLYSFPAPYLYAPYPRIFLQDMQDRMNWNSEDPNFHFESADLSYLPMN